MSGFACTNYLDSLALEAIVNDKVTFLAIMKKGCRYPSFE